MVHAEESRNMEGRGRQTGCCMVSGETVPSSTISQVPQKCNWAKYGYTCSSPARKP